MSSIKLKHSGGNSVSLNPPTSAPTSSDVAFKLPTSDGSAGQVLMTDGSGNLSWVNTGGVTMADQWRLHTAYDIPTNSTSIISTANWERPDTAQDGFGQLGTGMSVNSSNHAAGVWTFPSTGFYLVSFAGMLQNPNNNAYEVFVRIEATENGGTNFGEQTRIYLSGEDNNYMTSYGQAIIDVTDTSQVKLRLRAYSAVSDSDLKGNSGRSETYLVIIRLGDT